MTNFKKGIIIPILLICLSSFAKDIYVAKDGNDSNPGTEASPYLTISKAASVAVAGDVVYIKNGTYEETLAPANSGTEGNPIVFQSYPGHRVIITAMEALSGWTKDTGDIYKTTVPFGSLGQENFVMHNTRALDYARWPNKTSENPFELNTIRNDGGSDGDTTFNSFLESSQIPDINWAGGAVWFYGDSGGAGWLAWKSLIKSSESGKVTFDLNKSQPWIGGRHAPKDKGDFFLEGVKAALDYQNEWYYSSSTNELFVQLPGGAKPADWAVKMRRRRTAIDLRDMNYIEIRNLAVFGGKIDMSDSSEWNQTVSIRNTRTTHNKLYGVSSFYGGHTQGIFTGFASDEASVTVKGSFNVVEKCEIAFGAATGMNFAGISNVLKDCRIHDFNYLGAYDAPVRARGGKNVKIMNNEIFNGGRDGIQFNGENCEIAYNDVSRSNLIADDCALFYTVGPQYTTELHHNWFHDVASSGTKSKAAGIYLDNDAAGFNVYRNVVWNTEWTGIQINWNGKDINIYNNTLYNNEDGAMGAWHLAGTAFSNVNVWNMLTSDDKLEPQSDKQNNQTVDASVYQNVASGDFRLKAGSSPIDQGRTITGYTEGFKGNNPDIGAYEFGGEDWTPGISWDPKLSPNELGCYGLPGEDCILLPTEDADGDGVADVDDICPNTPSGATVNTSGCEVFVLSNDNFKLLVSGELCASQDNGSISIEAKENLTYTAKITGTTNEKTFSDTTKFENLAAGDYEVCITTTADSDYQQCFNVTIVEPALLGVVASVNDSNNTVSLNLSGSDLYRIELNDRVVVTDEDEIVLDLKSGENKLSVKTNKICQGVHQQKIVTDGKVMNFTNPVGDELIIKTANFDDSQITYQIYSSTGQLVKQNTISVSQEVIRIDVASLSSGFYYVHINSQNHKVQSKIIKK